jgi:hypothetical protein
MASSGVVSKMLIDMFAIFKPQRVIVQSLEYRSKMLAASRDVPAQSVKVSEYSAQFFLVLPAVQAVSPVLQLFYIFTTNI